jgi:Domain of unknown function (DUF4190)
MSEIASSSVILSSAELPPSLPLLPPPLPAAAYLFAAARPAKSHQAMAIGSLVCALFGIFLFSPLLSIVAVILGAIARKKMRKSGNFSGSGAALAGIIIAAIELSFLFFIVAVVVVAAIFAPAPMPDALAGQILNPALGL